MVYVSTFLYRIHAQPACNSSISAEWTRLGGTEQWAVILCNLTVCALLPTLSVASCPYLSVIGLGFLVVYLLTRGPRHRPRGQHIECGEVQIIVMVLI